MKVTSSRWALSLMAVTVGPLSSCDRGDWPVSAQAQLETVGLLTNAVQVADPHRARFPDDDYLQCFARSIWDMHTFEGRIYLGGGDLARNTGPTEVWSLSETGVVTDLQLETVVQDEMVVQFRDCDGTLFIPGSDATESWRFGNFYLKHEGHWQKRRTIPGALHVFDIASLEGTLYAAAMTLSGESLFSSSDNGLSWTALESSPQVTGLVAAGDSLFAISRRIVQEYRDGVPGERLRGPNEFWARSVAFAGGVLFGPAILSLPDLRRAPLVHVSAEGARTVERFEGLRAAVRDILVEDSTVFVLLARRGGNSGGFRGIIVGSEDTVEWFTLADFLVPAPPYSFAQLDGRFYVGLGVPGGDRGSVPVRRALSGGWSSRCAAPDRSRKTRAVNVEYRLANSRNSLSRPTRHLGCHEFPTRKE